MLRNFAVKKQRYALSALKVILLSTLVIAVTSCATSKDASRMTREEKTKLVNDVWEKACQVIKANLRNDMSKYVQFSKRPSKKVIPPTWNFRWQNVNIPIPAVKYDDVIVLPGPTIDKVDVMFVQKDGVVVNLRDIHDFIPLDEVVANLATLTGQTVSTEVGREFSSVLYDRAMPISEIIDIGYRNTPDNMSCEKRNMQGEIPLIIGLVVKASNSGEMLAVHKDIGEYRGWVEKSSDKDGIMWQTFIATASANDVLLAGFHTPKQSEYNQIGFAVGYINESTSDNFPKWWKPLGELLVDVDYFHLDQLRKAFVEAGLSDRSVKSVEQYIELLQR